MNELLTWVQAQRERIGELADLMKQHASSPKRGEEAFVLLTESDVEVWDQEVRVFQEPAARSDPMPAKVQPPMQTPPRVKSSAAGKGNFLAQQPSRIAGVASLVGTTSPGTPSPSSPANDQARGQGSQHANQSLAWTTTAMDQWGQKRVTWGKKHPGKTYQLVYETDSQYVSWCLSRINSLDAQIGDFARYCQTRQQMEEQLHQSQGLM